MHHQSTYHKAIKYLEEEIRDLWKYDCITEKEMFKAIDGLKDLSAAEIMQMYKDWKDC